MSELEKVYLVQVKVLSAHTEHAGASLLGVFFAVVFDPLASQLQKLASKSITLLLCFLLRRGREHCVVG